MVSSFEYIACLLYNGFYCFEVITERNLDDQICGICGIIGEVYLGDGNQKNCCTTSEVHRTCTPELLIFAVISKGKTRLIIFQFIYDHKGP